MNYISKNTRVDKGVELEAPVRTYGGAIIKKNVKIGKFTLINDRTCVFPSTHIGRYCSIGKNCEIGAFDHPIDTVSSSPAFYNVKGHFPGEVGTFTEFKVKRPKGPQIGNDVWLGSGVLVRRGISIGDGAVVAAGAVVTKDVPPYAIVGGLPAKVIRYRFSEEIIKDFLALQWWDLSPEVLAQVDFSNVEIAITQLKLLKKKLGVASSKASSKKGSDKCDSDIISVITGKMLALDISDELIDHVSVVEGRIFTDYDFYNEMDNHILNNKLKFIQEYEMEEKDSEKRKALLLKILKTKE